MKRLRQMEGKLSLLLILAISVLCICFLIVSCGKPQQKTKDADKGAYAIDFSKCPAGKVCAAIPKGSEVNPVPDMGNRQLTLEAWVKTSVSSTTGTIFKRSDGSRGVELNLDNNVPKFIMRRVPGVTGTEAFTVSGSALNTDTWYHIAGVIANADTHSPTSTIMLQTPHLDIYVNGAYISSATTNSHFADNPANEEMVMGFLNGAVIDEVRIWGSGRTEAEIVNCMNTELGIGGQCDRGDTNLAAYFRLNEGAGADITDFSGNGFSGGFEYSVGDNVFVEWEDGWVTPGAPITPAD